MRGEEFLKTGGKVREEMKRKKWRGRGKGRGWGK